MSATVILAVHELRRMWVQPWSWGILAAVLVVLAWLFLLSLDAFLNLAPRLASMPSSPGVTDLVAAPLLRVLANLLLFLVPLVSMRTLAGERRAHSLSLLLAAGIGDSAIVIGKWLAVFVWLLLLIGLASLLPLSLAAGTSLDLGKLAAAILGLVCEAGALAAIGVLASSWTAQPVLAAAIALGINLLLNLVDTGARLNGISTSAINWLALPTHLDPLFRGVVASVDIGYFAIITVVCLALAARRVGALRSAD